jgi:hypothetical protein
MAIQFYDSIDLNRQQLLNVRIQNVASDPTSNNVIGQIIFNTQDDTLKQYVDDAGSGSPGWVAVGGVTYDLLVTESTGGSTADPFITLDPSVGANDNVQIEGGAGVTVTKDGTAKITIAASGGTGTVTEVSTNNGLTGGTITTTGTIGLKLDDTDNYIMGRSVAIAASADTIAFNDADATTANTVVKTTFATIPMAALTLVKEYIDDAVVGGLIYQGGYNAATNSPDLDSSPSSDIKKGWTYTVTADGNFFLEQVRVGDVLIAEVNAPTTIADWTTVQNNIDLASLTEVGIGNVNASAAPALDGLSVTYSSGTATIGVDVPGLTDFPNEPAASGDSLIIYDTSDSTNKEITVANLLSGTSGVTTFAANVTSITAGTPKTVTHSLDTRDVIVQLFDDATKETIYATVDRATVDTVDLTFNATAPTTVRILVQKIG